MAVRLNTKESQYPPESAQELNPIGFSSLPLEVQVKIFSLLGVRDLGIVGTVSWQWHELSNEASLWRLFLRQRGLEQKTTEHPRETYRSYSYFYSNLLKGVYATGALEGHEQSLAFLVIHDRILYSVCSGGSAKSWKDSKFQKTFIVEGACDFIAVHRERLISGSADFGATIWDLQTGASKIVSDEGIHEGSPPTDSSGSKGTQSLVVSGDMLMICSVDDTIRVWNLTTDTCLYDAQESGIRVAAAASKAFILGYEDGVIKILNSEPFELDFIRQPEQQSEDENVTALIATSKYVIAGFKNGRMEIWDLEGRVRKNILQEHSGEIASFAIDRDILFSASFDNTIKIWDLNTEKCLQTLPIHEFSCDLNKLCIAALDGKLFLASKTIGDEESEQYNCKIKFWDFMVEDNSDRMS